MNYLSRHGSNVTMCSSVCDDITRKDAGVDVAAGPTSHHEDIKRFVFVVGAVKVDSPLLKCLLECGHGPVGGNAVSERSWGGWSYPRR